MKKTIIAGAAGIATLSAAVLPFAGVFAEGATVRDDVTLTVGESCLMTTEGHAVDGKYNLGSTLNGKAVLGGANGIQGTDMLISCNNNAGWTLSVEATALTSGVTENDIPFGAYAEDTTKSVWSVKLVGDNVLGAYASFDGARGTGSATVASKTGYTAPNKITPYYKAYVKENQPSGTYNGSITYTFAENN